MSKVRPALGKGLSALIPGAQEGDTLQTREIASHERRSTVITHQTSTASVSEIELDLIAPNPLQPRKDFEEQQLLDLASSIKEHGVIQAVTVRKVAENSYELVSGERRLRAARLAGLNQIPAYVLGVDNDRTMLELAIIENVQRSQLNPIEEAEAYDRLIRECGLTQDDVATKISRDRTTISNFLRLLKLPESIKESLRRGELGFGHAKAVMATMAPEEQESIWRRAVSENLSVRKVEEMARAASRNFGRENEGHRRPGRPTRPASTGEVTPSAEVTGLENEIKQLYGTQVKIRMRQDNSGEIGLHFYGIDDLERLYELLISARAEQ